jgi:predicted ThiF/HesA family dinucleotide-utilizing enzyme
VVVVAAVLVVDDDQECLAPQRGGGQRVDHLREERLADDDVLRVLLRLGAVVGIEEAELRQRADRCV